MARASARPAQIGSEAKAEADPFTKAVPAPTLYPCMFRVASPILFLLVLAVGVALAGVVFSRFDARTEGNDIIVSWEASVETDVREYVLERRTIFDTQFLEMARLRARGPNTLYVYRDRRVFKVQAEQVSYRLRMIDDQGSLVAVTDPITVDYTPTAVRRTWGSIKAMFL